MAITTKDGLLTAMADARKLAVYKPSTTLGFTGAYRSWWRLAGIPTQPAIPSTAVALDNTSLGALPFTDPAGGQTAYIGKVNLTQAANGIISIFDRLSHMGGLVANSTSPQTVNTAAITRPNANGENTQAFVEGYTNASAGSTTGTVSYTNSAGTNSRTGTFSFDFAGSATMFEIIPQDGDTGFKSVETLTFTGANASAGNFGVTIVRKVCDIYVGPDSDPQGPMDLCLPQVPAGACLFLASWRSASTSGNLSGSIDIVYG